MAAVGGYHALLLLDNGQAVGIGSNAQGQCDVPTLPEGMSYIAAAAADTHSVLIRSDGHAFAFGSPSEACALPEPPEDVRYIAATAGYCKTILIRDDGQAVVAGDGPHIDQPPEGIHYMSAATKVFHAVLIRDDGTATAFGLNVDGQCDVPDLPENARYLSAAVGLGHSVLIREDGEAAAFGANDEGQCDVPRLPAGKKYIAAAAADAHTLLMRDDGTVIAFGGDSCGQCCLPVLEDGAQYVAVDAKYDHSILLRDDGKVVLVPAETLEVPLPPDGAKFALPPTLVLQLTVISKSSETLTLSCRSLAGSDRVSLACGESCSVMELYKRISHTCKIAPSSLKLLLPDGTLLSQQKCTTPIGEILGVPT